MPTGTTAEHLERGRTLFNTDHFFEAHEVWEEAWLREHGDRRVLLQGLIQIAAGLLKASRAERPSGCAQLLAAGLEKLDSFRGDPAGLDLAEFCRSVEEFQAAAAPWLEGKTPSPREPFPRLQRTAAPRDRKRRFRKRPRRAKLPQ